MPLVESVEKNIDIGHTVGGIPKPMEQILQNKTMAKIKVIFLFIILTMTFPINNVFSENQNLQVQIFSLFLHGEILQTLNIERSKIRYSLITSEDDFYI